MTQNAILLIIDGVGDLPSKKFTPLQMAKTPNMNELTMNSVQGLMSPIAVGTVPGSDIAHLQILGYAPEKYYIGRGPLEALGANVELKEGDIAFRANFATLLFGNEITDRRAGRIESKTAKELENEINQCIQNLNRNGLKIIFKSTVEHRGVLVLRGKNLSANVSATDSHKLGKLEICKPLDSSAEAKKTAEIINMFTKIVHEKLKKSKLNLKREFPANIVLVRGAGIYRSAPKFEEVHGIKSACIAGGALYKGIAHYLGMNVIEVKGANATKNTDLHAKGLAAQKALEKCDFVFVHVKATDSFSHDGDVKGKVKFIEKIDKELIPLLKKTDAALIITGDHSTVCALRRHTGYDVPILVYEKNGRKDGLKKFDEISAMKGGLGHILGKDVMPIILNIIGKAKIYGS